MATLTRGIGIGLLAIAILLVGVSARAQVVAGSLDAAGRRTAVQEAADALRNRYVFPEVGIRAAEKIEAALAAGSYDELQEPRAFAEGLTTDLRNATKDKHLRVSASGPAPVAAGAAPPRSEGGVVRADRLAGNIGYVEINGFPSPAVFKLAVDRAMPALSATKALIIDVRRNGGGSPDSVAYLVSHFLDPAKRVLINDFINRNPGTTEFTTSQSWSLPTLISYRDKPVYVLTSGATFSGGEEFAYDMQVMKLGVLVGETTGGGANPGGMIPIGPQFAMFVPGGRPRNPITGTNWEGVGVKPNVITSSEDALKVALERIGQKPAAAEIDALSEARLFEPRTKPQAVSEAAIRRAIDEFVRGEPNYDLMAPELAQATREQLPALKELFTSLGTMQSVTFLNVGPQGQDVYEVKFANGSITWRIVVTADGKTVASGISRTPPAPI